MDDHRQKTFMSERSARIHVLLFTTQLGSGGAEMQTLQIANHLDRKRFVVQLAVMRGGGSYEPALASDVALHTLTGKSIPAKIGSLRKLVAHEQPDVVCSFLEIPNLMGWAATKWLKPRPHLVACVQAPPSITWSGGGWRRILRALVASYYSRAERIIAISRGVATDIAGMAPQSLRHMDVVMNAGLDERVEAGAALPPGETLPDGPLLVACGRLVEQKGFSYLLDAMSLVRKSLPDASLWIVGEGPDRSTLEGQIANLSLRGSVRLLGFHDNPYRFMAAADVFVLSSIFEGFGNVIVEAMASGTAVVSTDCPYGPSEIISDGVNGLLVPPRNPQALAEAIVRVLRDDDLKAKLKAGGEQRSKHFGAKTIAEAYASVFESLTGAR